MWKRLIGAFFLAAFGPREETAPIPLPELPALSRLDTITPRQPEQPGATACGIDTRAGCINAVAVT